MASADKHMKMSVETDNNLQKILDTTLGSFLDLVQCDAGSVYTVRKDSDGESILTFEAMITRSINVDHVPGYLRSLKFRIDDSSIVGKTAVYRRPILLDLGSAENKVSPGVGETLNYATRNLFSGPLITPRGDLVGVEDDAALLAAEHRQQLAVAVVDVAVVRDLLLVRRVVLRQLARDRGDEPEHERGHGEQAQHQHQC